MEMNQRTALLRPGEFARELGVTTQTVKNWLDREERQAGAGLKFIRFPGGERRIPASELDRIFSGALN